MAEMSIDAPARPGPLARILAAAGEWLVSRRADARRRRVLNEHIVFLSGELQTLRREHAEFRARAFDVVAELDQALAMQKCSLARRTIAREHAAALKAELMPAVLRHGRGAHG